MCHIAAYLGGNGAVGAVPAPSLMPANSHTVNRNMTVETRGWFLYVPVGEV